MSSAESRTGEVQDVRETANRLRIAISAFTRRFQEVARIGDLSNPQLTALSRLDRLGPMTTSALARRERITPQAMGATIASLEALGLVERNPDATDGRRSILSLTAEGRTAIQSGRNAVDDKVTAALKDSFTDKDIETLSAAAPLIERLAGLL
ncbi:MarR family transcriptional regulator [Streptomyces iakyrus]|uniref:MarR family winged helix-turn-helix transcriptional regulator n=1 Tax=Streptomyces iakyrus TaxID=68219 RepID=UPI0007C4874C|nr:MarR family transcriptional regulator [Streptomyces iakyrus]